MSTRDRVLQIAKAKPDATLAEMGNEVGVTRERVRQILVSAGVERNHQRGRPRFRRSDLPRQDHPQRWGRKISTHANGRIGELYVALDLLRRGYDVFTPIVWTQSCDLMAISREHQVPMRLEIKNAKRRPNGNAEFSKPTNPDCYDYLVLVFPDGSIEYRPELAEDT